MPAIASTRQTNSQKEWRVPLPVLQPKADLYAESLRDVIDRFVSSSGPLAALPILGPLTKDEWSRFHCMHSASPFPQRSLRWVDSPCPYLHRFESAFPVKNPEPRSYKSVRVIPGSG